MEAIERAFKTTGNFVFKDREALQQCRELADEHSLKPSDIASHYDAYFSMMDSSTFDVTTNNVLAFAKFLAKEMAASVRSKQAAAVKTRVVARTWEELQEYPTPKRPASNAAKESLLNFTPGSTRSALLTPKSMRSPLQATPGSINTSFQQRTTKGQIHSSYNEALDVSECSQGPKDAASLCTLQLLGESLVVPGVRHLHMVDSLEGKVHAINDRILAFGEALKQVLPDAADVLKTSVTEITQEPVWVVGRVVPEWETGGTLNEQSVQLEGSREGSSGARVRLDLSHLQSFRLFPGQVVCVKGLNPTGSVFMAQQLVTHVPPARSNVPAAKGQDGGQGLSMVVAAGPFTTSDNMLYEPLDELLKYCSGSNVDQVLLMGPFVDVEHPSIKDGSLRTSFDQVFREEVLVRVAAWQQQAGNQGRRVVLMPAVRDAHAPPVFPQPPFPALEGSGEAAPLRSLQNPCCFASEGLVVAASSQDVLMHLSAGEIARGQGLDRMSALASHVIGQQSFYPLFPPALGACVDTSHYGVLQLASSPDVLLLPSNLAPFAKLLPPSQALGGCTDPSTEALEAVVAVNPGRLAKGVSGGTFAHVYFAPTNSGAKDSNAPISVHQRVRVDIRKL